MKMKRYLIVLLLLNTSFGTKADFGAALVPEAHYLTFASYVDAFYQCGELYPESGVNLNTYLDLVLEEAPEFLPDTFNREDLAEKLRKNSNNGQKTVMQKEFCTADVLQKVVNSVLNIYRFNLNEKNSKGTIKSLYKEWKSKGFFPCMGIGVKRYSRDALYKSASQETPYHAIVEAVEPDGPASKAGFRVGDRIIEIDEKPVKYDTDMLLRTLSVKPGQSTILKVERSGSEILIDLQIGKKKAGSKKSACEPL